MKPSVQPGLSSRISGLSLPALRVEWRSTFACEPPRHRSRDLMARAFVHQHQLRAHGDLSPVRKRRLLDLARRFRANKAYDPSPNVSLPPGSAVMREWRGVRHVVAVTEDGFTYEGQAFGSLSHVARHITGTRWNGLAFFGLTEGRKVADQ